MKRAGHLLPCIAERANLALAAWKASRGRRGEAVVRRFAARLDENLGVLSREIREGTVAVSPYLRFAVRDPKPRVIHAAPFRSRVLHHAIMNVCGPHLERGAIDDSYACRLGKGNSAALLRARHFAARHKHFLKLDVRRYFDSIDHARLKRRYRRLFKDAGLVFLFDRIVDSYGSEPGKGVPIGTLASQYFGNFYLDRLDRYVKEGLRCRAYLRFMDDFVLWHDSARQLACWQAAIGEWLRTELALELKSSARLGRADEGMLFLGFRVMPGRLLLGRRARRRFRSRLAGYERACLYGAMGEPELQRRVGALVAYTDQAECRAWRRRVLAARCELTESEAGLRW